MRPREWNFDNPVALQYSQYRWRLPGQNAKVASVYRPHAHFIFSRCRSFRNRARYMYIK